LTVPGTHPERVRNHAPHVGRIGRVPTVAVVGGASNVTNRDLVRNWQALGIDACLLSGAEARDDLQRGDIAVARLDVLPTLDGIDGGLLELLELRADGIRVVNGARALLNAHDKLRTAHRLSIHGVPHVPTHHVRKLEEVELRPPLAVKPRFGSWGTDVLRCDDDDALSAVFAEIATRPWFRKHGAIVQPLIAPMGRELRIVVAGGRVVGAESRVSAPGEWRTNTSLGGTHLPTAAWRGPSEIALAAAVAVDADFVGVDLLPSSEGYLVLEVNGAVEFDGTYSVSGDIYEEAAGALGLVGVPITAPAFL
jgi:[lysine-biosynthesis-protein LysW]---L-2-aminoadipate ligase